ncbi:MAG: hypothetical protein ACKVQB_08045, partial [Bacteroidia bacterium]
MSFLSSLKKILTIFYSRGSRQFLFVFLISLVGIVIEMACLLLLYLVVSNLIQLNTIIIFPLINLNLATHIGVIVLVAAYFLKFIFSIFQNR